MKAPVLGISRHHIFTNGDGITTFLYSMVKMMPEACSMHPPIPTMKPRNRQSRCSRIARKNAPPMLLPPSFHPPGYARVTRK